MGGEVPGRRGGSNRPGLGQCVSEKGRQDLGRVWMTPEQGQVQEWQVVFCRLPSPCTVQVNAHT